MAAPVAEKAVLEPETLFFEGPPSKTELIVPGLSVLTGHRHRAVRAAAAARQAWVKYKITSRRISVQSGVGGQDFTEIVYSDIAGMKFVYRGSKDVGDLVISLRDGAKLEMRFVPQFRLTAATSMNGARRCAGGRRRWLHGRRQTLAACRRRDDSTAPPSPRGRKHLTLVACVRIYHTLREKQRRILRGQESYGRGGSSASAASTRTTDEPASECATTAQVGAPDDARGSGRVGERVERREAREDALRRRRVAALVVAAAPAHLLKETAAPRQRVHGVEGRARRRRRVARPPRRPRRRPRPTPRRRVY